MTPYPPVQSSPVSPRCTVSPVSGSTTFTVTCGCTRPMVAVGDISYSWYLWHRPLIVFAAVLIPNEPTVLVLEVGPRTSLSGSAQGARIYYGGTNATAKQAAFDNLSPTATRAGDVVYWNGTHWVNLLNGWACGNEHALSC